MEYERLALYGICLEKDSYILLSRISGPPNLLYFAEYLHHSYSSALGRPDEPAKAAKRKHELLLEDSWYDNSAQAAYAPNIPEYLAFPLLPPALHYSKSYLFHLRICTFHMRGFQFSHRHTELARRRNGGLGDVQRVIVILREAHAACNLVLCCGVFYLLHLRAVNLKWVLLICCPKMRINGARPCSLVRVWYGTGGGNTIPKLGSLEFTLLEKLAVLPRSQLPFR
jgi:hypothetical protein